MHCGKLELITQARRMFGMAYTTAVTMPTMVWDMRELATRGAIMVEGETATTVTMLARLVSILDKLR